MKLPKLTKTYCRTCKVHQEQKISIAKNRTRGSSHPMSQGSKLRMELRGQARGMGNLGKTSRGSMNSWKRFNKKQSKKPDIRYTCKVCNKTSSGRTNKRAKKIEFQ